MRLEEEEKKHVEKGASSLEHLQPRGEPRKIIERGQKKYGERAFPYFMFWMMMTTLCGLNVCYMFQVLDA